MNAATKRSLKRLGKAEVERRSAEIRAALKEANPAPSGSGQWAKGYRVGLKRELWLQRALPILHRERLHELFVVLRQPGTGWVPHPGGYVICNTCGSAAPSLMPWKLFYWASCACGNIRWRCFLGWRRGGVRNPDGVTSAKLCGRGSAPQDPSALQADHHGG